MTDLSTALGRGIRRWQLARPIEELNQLFDRLCDRFGGFHIDLSEDPNTYEREHVEFARHHGAGGVGSESLEATGPPGPGSDVEALR